MLHSSIVCHLSFNCIPRLAKQYGADALREEVVGGMRGQLARENTYSGLSELGDLLALHCVEELQEDCVKKIHTIEVDEKNFASFMKLAGDEHNNRQQVGDDGGQAALGRPRLYRFLYFLIFFFVGVGCSIINRPSVAGAVLQTP